MEDNLIDIRDSMENYLSSKENINVDLGSCINTNNLILLEHIIKSLNYLGRPRDSKKIKDICIQSSYNTQRRYSRENEFHKIEKITKRFYKRGFRKLVEKTYNKLLDGEKYYIRLDWLDNFVLAHFRVKDEIILRLENKTYTYSVLK